MSKHTREVRADATPTALCSSYGTERRGISPRPCPDGHCPRHRPANYAEYMARHSVDSIPSRTDRAERFHTFGITR